MKTFARFLSMSFLAALMAAPLYGQVKTKEEWQQAMKDAQARRETLTQQVQTLQSDVDKLKQEDAAKADEAKKCQEDLAAAQQELNSLLASLNAEGAPTVYVVGTWAKDRDCLWNIAKKPKIYNDVWLWPKIWQANRDEIKNADLIYPHEKLQIPRKAPLTKNETLAEQRYFANRHLPAQRAQK